MISGLFIIAVASGAIGYLIAVLFWRWWTGAEMAAARDPGRPFRLNASGALLCAVRMASAAHRPAGLVKRDFSLWLFGAAALASAALLLWAARDPIFAAAFLAGLAGAGGLLLLRRAARRSARRGGRRPGRGARSRSASRRARQRAADSGAGADRRRGRGDLRQPGLDRLVRRLGACRRVLAPAAAVARRDLAATIPPLSLGGHQVQGAIDMVGGDGHLLWRLTRSGDDDLVRDARRLRRRRCRPPHGRGRD